MLVLVGAWSDNREADQKIVAEIMNSDYESVERLLRRWGKSKDPPFRRSGNFWRLANPEDAWTLLNDRIIRDDLERWRNAVLKVLGTRDPLLDLDPQGRFMASVRGDEQRWSFDLRRGLAQGVALLAALDLPRSVGGRTGPDHAESLVRDLLGCAGGDDRGKLWRQLSDVLPLLAEAAPEVFLDTVRRDSIGEEPLVRNMFTDRPDAGSPWNEAFGHTGLLWALETVCWSSDHLSEALKALVRLAEIDPGGRLANRPLDSATNVLLPWRPQTGASPGRRLDVLDGLLKRHEETGQELSSSLLSRTSMSPNTRPRFRDWAPDHSQLTTNEVRESRDGIIDRTLAAIRDRPSKFVRWIDQLPQLAAEEQKTVIQYLKGLDQETLDKLDRLIISESMKGLLNRYSDSTVLEDNLYPGGKLALEEITRRLGLENDYTCPEDQISGYAELFSWDPASKDERQAAVISSYKTGGLDCLLELTECADNFASVGITAACTFEDSQLLDLLRLISTTNCNHELAMSWIRQRAETQGLAWVEEMSTKLGGLRAEVQAIFFRSVRPESHIWKLLDQGDATVRETYWRTVNHWVVPPCDVSTYVSYLIRFDRPWLAVCAVTVGMDENTSPPTSVEDIKKILTALLRSRSTSILSSSNAYRVGKLLDVLELQEPDSEVLRIVELAFFSQLQVVGRVPNAVYRRLQSDPSFFVDLVCFLNSQPEETEESTFISSDVAWSLLHEWKVVPGTDTDNSRIEYSTLREWVIKARRLFEERRWTEIGDMYIGELLSASTTGRDGVWPAEEVRVLLEELDNDVLDEGLVSGAEDLGGLPMRGLHEGGTQERDLASRYGNWARRVDSSWPRTGRALRQLAKSYKTYACRADETSERFADLD